MPRTCRTSRARILYLLVAALIVTAAIVAGHVLAASERGRATPSSSGTDDSPSGTNVGQGKLGTTLAPEYAPSEKVSADKTVSFPTDI